ncbi:hypothetical protein F5Y05DRAFT_40625 [Hypoxylon sp. FL0543]|nr:hypothetical protein F5Y05DRAFT_40625 [Hypoxylon sp. FL0543]
MASTTGDTVVSIDTPMPRGYTFLPKGNAYKTLNCRKKARAEGHEVYVVHDSKHRQMGIRVPRAIYHRVQEMHRETRESRAQAVEKKDKKMEAGFQGSILSQFPKIPKSELREILRHALRKHSGRVGRTGKLDLDEKAQLAVRARIRHHHTDYDKLLADKVSKDLARKQILKKVHDIAVEWGWASKAGKWKGEWPGETPSSEQKPSREARSNHKPKNRFKELPPQKSNKRKRSDEQL